MTLAGEYAYAGRDVVVDKVLEILGTQAIESIHNHHNYAWKETHRGEDVWVIRKGCTPAWPGQQGFVGATMGEPSVILEGIESPAMVDLLYSTVHGAGRVMSRSQAAGKIRRFNVWECNDRRGCAYRAPKGQQLAGGERVPCSRRSAWRWPAPTCLTRSRTDPEVIAAPLALVHSSAPTSSRPSAPQRRLTCRRVRRNGR
jgi:hypothetical protein